MTQTPLIHFRLENSDVYDGYVNVRVWAGSPGSRMSNCGILVFYEEEWLAFQTLLKTGSPAVSIVQAGLESTLRQVRRDDGVAFNPEKQVFTVRPQEEDHNAT